MFSVERFVCLSTGLGLQASSSLPGPREHPAGEGVRGSRKARVQGLMHVDTLVGYNDRVESTRIAPGLVPRCG